MKRIVLCFVGALLFSLGACEEDGSSLVGTDYFEYSYVDTVLAADTIQNNDVARIVSLNPRHCSYFERIELKEHGDTLEVAALYHSRPEGGVPHVPCYQTVVDTVSYQLAFSSAGARYLSYVRRIDGDHMRIIQPIYVRG
jgi:hypothetical protein